MIILGIETSCDETACAILLKEGNRITILSNIVSSSLQIHAKYGGIIPEQAAREQLKFIIPVVEEAISQAFPRHPERSEGSSNFISNISLEDSSSLPQNDIINKIDAIAVTYGPGLIGSLLVGVETAKVLATVWNKPLIPVNHLIGHFYANWIGRGNPSTTLRKYSLSEAKRNRSASAIPKFPCIGLLVSGGHTDLVLFKNHAEYEHLGGTRDDAAGECFDKCARVLGYPYPGGPKISKLAESGNPEKYSLPHPMANSKDLDFSFSGLKTAFVNLIDTNFKIDRGFFDAEKQQWIQIPLEEQLTKSHIQEVYNLCASLQETIIKVLTYKTVAAAKKYLVEQIIVAGGVAANQQLKNELISKTKTLGIQLHIPEPKLCTDNGAMIAAAGFYSQENIDPLKLQANPSLSL